MVFQKLSYEKIRRVFFLRCGVEKTNFRTSLYQTLLSILKGSLYEISNVTRYFSHWSLNERSIDEEQSLFWLCIWLISFNMKQENKVFNNPRKCCLAIFAQFSKPSKLLINLIEIKSQLRSTFRQLSCCLSDSRNQQICLFWIKDLFLEQALRPKKMLISGFSMGHSNFKKNLSDNSFFTFQI